MSESGSSGRRSRSRGVQPIMVEPNDLAEEVGGLGITADEISFNLTETKDSLAHKIKSKLGSHNYHSKWICDFDAFERDANTVYDILTCKFTEIARQEDESELKYSALEVIGRKFTQLFTGAYLRKFGKMEGYLREAKALVTHSCNPAFNYVPVDYLQGLMYCLTGIEAYYLTRLPRKSSTFKRLENIYRNLGSFRLLTVKEQVAVLAMKQSFIGHMDRNSFGEQSEILDQMIKLDSTNGDWYHWRYNVMRFQRRQQWQFSSPSKKELEAITTATKLSPKNPRILISLYSVLAEMVRCRGPQWDCQKEIQGIGLEREFNAPIEIVLYLKAATRKVLVLDPMSVKVNITVAEIFSSTLPHQYLDVVFAKMCIERALLFHPNSSKANARMGIFLLNNNGNRKEAIKYFIRSLEQDRRNFPTLLDLLFCYISDHGVYYRSIETILTRELTNADWAAPNLGRLHFVKGLHCYLLWKHKKALESWILTFKLCGDILGFKNFGNLRKKYGWESDMFDLNTIYLMANSTMGAYSTAKRNVLRAIVAALREGLQKEKYFSANPKPSYPMPFRGSYNRGRGFCGSDLQHGGFVGGSGAPWLKQSNAPPKACSSSTSEDILEYVQENPPVEETAHEVLGLEPEASLEEIKAAYRKLCFEFHPDKNRGRDADAYENNLERMKKINVAFEELTCKRRSSIPQDEKGECMSIKN